MEYPKNPITNDNINTKAQGKKVQNTNQVKAANKHNTLVRKGVDLTPKVAYELTNPSDFHLLIDTMHLNTYNLLNLEVLSKLYDLPGCSSKEKAGYTSYVSATGSLVPLRQLVELHVSVKAVTDARLRLFIGRALILEIFKTTLPENLSNMPSFTNLLQRYLKSGSDPLIPVTTFTTFLAPLLEPMSEGGQTLFHAYLAEAKGKTGEHTNSKYAAVHCFLPHANRLFDDVATQYRKSYNLFKEGVDLIIAGFTLYDTPLYQEVKTIVIAKVMHLLGNASTNVDHVYYLHLLRLELLGEDSSGHYPKTPVFDRVQAKQLQLYLDEHIKLLILAEYINKLNPDSVKPPLLTALPISQLINKKPEHFYNKPVSNRSYTLLLMYLYSVTEVLTTQFVVNYSKSSTK